MTNKNKIHISKHSGKLEGFESMNVSCLDNKFCEAMSKHENYICSKCYARRLETIRNQLHDKLLSNNKILSEKVLPKITLPRVNRLYFRFNAFGELLNMTHLYNLVHICEVNPKTTFTLWSKRIDLISSLDLGFKPKNLIIIYSSPELNKRTDIDSLPIQFDKVFTVYSKDYIEHKYHDVNINCEQHCLTCLKCYTDNKIKYINERLK